MENQHRKIKGYRELNRDEIDAMNEIKAKGEELGALCENLKKIGGIDRRWLSEGKTDLQKGIMSLVRSVAQPESF